MPRILSIALPLWVAASLGACSGAAPEPAAAIPEALSGWELFDDAAAQTPAPGVIPFDVTAPLYSDGSTKLRFLRVPAGERIRYAESDPWGFPVGTVLVKTFAQRLDERDAGSALQLLETRLLVRGPERWTPLTYVWDAAQTEAYRVNSGDAIDTSWLDAAGAPRERTHIVPNTNECRDCHGTMENLDTLGGRTRMWNLVSDQGDGPENQIDHLAALGMFDTDPEPASERETLVAPFGDAPIEDRARAYMDTNCGSCHRPGRGEASQSGFLLSYEQTDPETQPASHWGVCKVPTSAGGATCGLTHDVVPGDPDRSILICRMESASPKVMMPPLGRTLVDTDGAALLREWIRQLPPDTCD